MGVPDQYIFVDGWSAPARISSIDYGTGTIILADPATWASGAGTYSPASPAAGFVGAAPDLGAFEYGSSPDEGCPGGPGCEYPPDSLTNSGTMTANSGNFAETRPLEKLWDGCFTPTDYTCTSGNASIASFWVEFDLGQEYDLTQARLFGDAGGDWVSRNWTLLYRLDPADSWETAFSGADAFFDDWSDQDLDVTARYVRVEVFGDQGGTQARELEIYGNVHVEKGLLLSLPLDEGSGLAASDSSGNGNDGTLMNGASWTTDSKTGGHALSFDGVDGYMSLDSPISFSDDDPYTIAFWVSTGDIDDWAGVLGPVESWSHFIMLSSSERLSFYETSTKHFVAGYLTPGEWYHAALVSDSGIMRWYLDGVQMNQTSIFDGSTTISVIGSKYSGADIRFTGKLDDIRVYNYALSPDEISRLASPHRADTSGDGCVDDPELMAFINHWYLDSTAYPMGELMEAVGLWKAGC